MIDAYRIGCLKVKPGDVVVKDIMDNLLLVEPSEQFNLLYLWYKEIDHEIQDQASTDVSASSSSETSLRTCKICGENKPIDDYYQDRYGRIRTECKNCCAEYQRRHKAEKLIEKAMKLNPSLKVVDK